MVGVPPVGGEDRLKPELSTSQIKFDNAKGQGLFHLMSRNILALTALNGNTKSGFSGGYSRVNYPGEKLPERWLLLTRRYEGLTFPLANASG